VHDVVPDLHVLEDLGDAERARAGREGERVDPEVQQGAASGLGVPRRPDDPPDVVHVALPQARDHLLAQRVQLAAERGRLLLRQAAAHGLHRVSPHRHSSRFERATETHGWMSSSSTLEIAPVRRSSTAPERFRHLHV
jgi:hypothetical protein